MKSTVKHIIFASIFVPLYKLFINVMMKFHFLEAFLEAFFLTVQLTRKIFDVIIFIMTLIVARTIDLPFADASYILRMIDLHFKMFVQTILILH